MLVLVHSVNIPAGSSVGVLTGFDEETGEEITFAGDHRAALGIGRVIENATDDSELPVCDVEAWQVLNVAVG